MGAFLLIFGNSIPYLYSDDYNCDFFGRFKAKTSSDNIFTILHDGSAVNLHVTRFEEHVNMSL